MFLAISSFMLPFDLLLIINIHSPFHFHLSFFLYITKSVPYSLLLFFLLFIALLPLFYFISLWFFLLICTFILFRYIWVSYIALPICIHVICYALCFAMKTRVLLVNRKWVFTFPVLVSNWSCLEACNGRGRVLFSQIS